MGTIADDDALEWRVDPRERLQQDIDTLSADNLARVDDEIALAEGCGVGGGGGPGYRSVNLDLGGREAILKEFGAHEVASHDMALESAVERDFPALGPVAYPLQRQAACRSPADRCPAGEDAVQGGCAATYPAAEDVVLVAAHAAEVMVVNHPDDGAPAPGKGPQRTGL